MSVTEATPRISFVLGRIRRAEPRVWVVRETEAAYDASTGPRVSVDAPPAAPILISARRVSRTQHPITTAAPLDRLCIRDDGDVLLIPIRSVFYVRRDDSGTTIETDQQSLKVRLTVNRLERVLAPFGFFRSHRAYLVNLRRVRRIVTWSRHVHNLMLDDSKETLVPLAKSRQSALRASLLWP